MTTNWIQDRLAIMAKDANFSEEEYKEHFLAKPFTIINLIDKARELKDIRYMNMAFLVCALIDNREHRIQTAKHVLQIKKEFKDQLQKENKP